MNEPSAPPDQDESSALIAAIAGDEDRQAFGRLFQRFAPLLKAYARRAGSGPSEAEELAQETLLTVWRKARQFDSARGSAAGWIFAIARNLRIDGQRRRSEAVFPPELFEDLAPPSDSLADGLAVVRLDEALRTLPADQRAVIEAAYIHHLAHAQIAKRLELPLGTVKSRLRLALRRLKAEMEGSQ